jgi:hypothetical protein
MPQPFANFVQSGSQSIALPWWSGIHAVPDFAQAVAHAHTMLATAFPFPPIARATLPTRPLDLDDRPMVAGFRFQRAGAGRR